MGKIQAGIIRALINAATTMALRRPTHWLRYPIMVPPTHAPVFMRMLAMEASWLPIRFWVFMKVV